jgi:hypothetical protein
MGCAGMTFRFLAAAVLALLLLAVPPPARAATSPDDALQTLLDQAAARCSAPARDVLAAVVCDKRVRIGAKTDYPQFGFRNNGQWTGFEIDLARALAARFGARAEFVGVTGANRISALAEGRVDLVIATMAHNTQRDPQARFVRPHYYQSETAVVGEKDLPVASMKDIVGRTTCMQVGGYETATFFTNGARVLLFDSPEKLLDGLEAGSCTLVAYDDSFFTRAFQNPAFKARFAQKLGLAPVPWGMATPLAGGADLARALGLALQVFHRDGLMLKFAAENNISTRFLEEQRAVWQRPECDIAAEGANPCVLPPLKTELAPTAFADQVKAVERFLSGLTDSDMSLPMLATEQAWALLKDGIANTFIILGGAVAATLVFTLGFGWLLSSRSWLACWPARLAVILLQSSPLVLSLVIAIGISNAIAPFSAATAMASAMIVLGLTNGANAGQAVSESMATLRLERPGGDQGLFPLAIGRARKQIEAFVISASKGTPVASFIGAPELVNALTDISSFSSARLTTYLFMIVFYVAMVTAVTEISVATGNHLSRRFGRQAARA